MAGTIRTRVERELSGVGGGWTSFGSDVDRDAGVTWSRGRLTGEPIGWLARTGILDFSINNSACNQDGLQGRYSPGHTNLLPGFDLDIRVRLVVSVGDGWCEADWSDEWAESAYFKVLWTGRIVSIEPDAGQYRLRRCRVVAHDWIDKLARQKAPCLDVEQGISEHDAVEAVLALMSVSPAATIVQEGPDAYDFAFDLPRSAVGGPRQELARIAESSMGVGYLLGDETFTWEPRNVQRAVDATLSSTDADLIESDIDADDELRAPTLRDARINAVEVEMTPRETGGSAEVLWEATQVLGFPPGETVFRSPFTTADESLPAGGINLSNPMSGTDYIFNSERDGSGTDVTASVDVTVSFCGGYVEWTLDNNTSAQAYAVDDGTGPGSQGDPLLRVQGTAVLSKDPMVFRAEDAADIAANGENVLTRVMPYQSRHEVAQAFATHLLTVYGTSRPAVGRVPVLLKPTDESRTETLLGLDISSLVSVTETMTALDGSQKYWINGERGELRGDDLLKRAFYIAPADQGPSIQFDADHLTTGGKNSTSDDIESATTAVITPTADYLILAWVANKVTDSADPEIPSVSGCGLTWTQEETVVYDGAGADRKRLTLFRALGSSPTTGALTIDNFGGTSEPQGRIAWSVAQFPTTGASSAAAVVQSKAGSDENVGSLAITFDSAFGDPANRPAGGFALDVPDTMEPEAAHTLLGRRSVIESMMTVSEPDAADTTITATIPGSSGRVGGIIVEVKKD